MRFYKLDEVPVSPDDVVVKESPVINAIAAAILFSLAGVGLLRSNGRSWVVIRRVV